MPCPYGNINSLWGLKGLYIHYHEQPIIKFDRAHRPRGGAAPIEKVRVDPLQKCRQEGLPDGAIVWQYAP